MAYDSESRTKPREGGRIKLFALNTQSIRNKIDALESYICDKKLQIICACEHFMTPEEAATLIIPGFVMATSFCRKSKKRGGSLILVSNELKSDFTELTRVINLSIEPVIEISAITLNDYNLNILSIYRTPGRLGDFGTFLSRLEQAICAVGHQRKILIAGDFNVHFLTNERENIALTDMLATYGFSQKVFFPTRADRCVDNIFINFDPISERVQRGGTGLSDHEGVVYEVVLPGKHKFVKSHSKICRPMTMEGKFTFYNVVENLDWSFIGSDSFDTGCKFRLFCEKLKEAYLLSFPEKVYKISLTKNFMPWFNSDLGNMRERVQFLSDLYRAFPSPDLLKEKKRYLRQYTQSIRLAKKTYNNNLVNRSDNKQKTIWNIINSTRKSTKEGDANTNISPDRFNDYFVNVATDLVRKQGLGINRSSNHIHLHPAGLPHKCFNFTEVTLIEVRDIVAGLANKKAKDKFGLSVHLMKTVRELIVAPLTKLINLCFRDCVFPTVLKDAIVIPIYKKGERENVSNYRPISLLPVLSKVLEKCMAVRISKYLEENHLFSEQQFGFRKGMGTTAAILNLVNLIMEGFHQKRHTSTVFCDLSKAFDCVSHDLLLGKLRGYNFGEGSLRLLESYLSDRRQRVSVGGVSSASRIVHTGVPQGSILGPLLFIIFINDLPLSDNAGNFVLFADDTTISLQDSDTTILAARTGEAQSRAKGWFDVNGLVLNEAKTHNMVFSLGGVGRAAAGAVSVGFLGVLLDPKLSWEAHIDALCKKLKRNIFALRNLAGTVSGGVLRTAYFALVHSLITYAVLVWGHAADWKRVFALQRRAVRVVAGLSYREDCSDSFVSLKILTFPNIFILENLMHVKNNMDCYPTNSNFHDYNTRYKTDLVTPWYRVGRCQNGPNVRAIKFYNKLPTGIRHLNTKAFKRAIRDVLLKNPFYDTQQYLSSDIFEC